MKRCSRYTCWLCIYISCIHSWLPANIKIPKLNQRDVGLAKKDISGNYCYSKLVLSLFVRRTGTQQQPQFFEAVRNDMETSGIRDYDDD